MPQKPVPIGFQFKRLSEIIQKRRRHRPKRLPPISWGRSFRHDLGMRLYGPEARAARAARYRDVKAEAPPTQQTLPPEKASGFVYFIQQASGSIKIGYSAYPDQRLKSLRTSSPEPMTLLAMTCGSRTTERRYHDRFSSHRLEGEWFYPHPEILAEIETLRDAKAA